MNRTLIFYVSASFKKCEQSIIISMLLIELSSIKTINTELSSIKTIASITHYIYLNYNGYYTFSKLSMNDKSTSNSYTYTCTF